MNAKAKHTPGPWVVDRKAKMVIGGNGEPVADLRGHTEHRGANARLIEVAPSMLSTLGKLAASYDHDDADLLIEAIGEARVLLAKIDGEG